MISQENKTKFLEILEEYPIVYVAAKRAGISTATIYRHKKDDPKFAKEIKEAIKKGREVVGEMIESRVISQAQKGDFKSQKFWLENNVKRFVKPRRSIVFDVENEDDENKFTYSIGI